jgi:hypothetical protein
MRRNGSGIRETARVWQMSPTTVLNTLKKKNLRSPRCINHSAPQCILTMWPW